MMRDLLELYILWDMDGTLFEFIYGGDIYRALYFEQLASNKSLCDAAKLLDGKTIGRYKLVSAVLSSYLTDSPHDVKQEKNNALDRDTSIPQENRIFIPCGTSKWKAVCERGIQDKCILIDDYGHNLEDWEGPCVKVSRDTEDMKKEMLKYEYCISPDLPAQEIAKVIMAAATHIY